MRRTETFEHTLISEFGKLTSSDRTKLREIEIYSTTLLLNSITLKMNPMKSTTLATVILAFAIAGMGNFAYSQEKLNEFMTETTPEERAQLQTDYMKESLSLRRIRRQKCMV